MGNYALNVLLHQLDKLDYAYDRFVKNGEIDSDSKVAKENREKAKSIDDAIKILSTNVDTEERQLTIPVLAPVKFIIRKMNGIMRGEMTLDETASDLYRNASYDVNANMRIELCVVVSTHYKTDCYLAEGL